jgi:hypothetical protein
MGGNALVQFTYGQRGAAGSNSAGWWIPKNWYGAGMEISMNLKVVDDVPDHASVILLWKGW